ncbi:hypothetical protein HaLaN_22099 [Haematococcus lacustris]|uniref:Uncharacterized protein n=1 Tax=Haematococcus lacustris TaxID=44745 RepID=A0A699ZQY2_HAELA|nr:hypothetical protein HaLaN_22099 [Haematococcus lacustris]
MWGDAGRWGAAGEGRKAGYLMVGLGLTGPGRGGRGSHGGNEVLIRAGCCSRAGRQGQSPGQEGGGALKVQGLRGLRLGGRGRRGGLDGLVTRPCCLSAACSLHSTRLRYEPDIAGGAGRAHGRAGGWSVDPVSAAAGEGWRAAARLHQGGCSFTAPCLTSFLMVRGESDRVRVTGRGTSCRAISLTPPSTWWLRRPWEWTQPAAA